MDGVDDGAGVLQLEAGPHTIPALSSTRDNVVCMSQQCKTRLDTLTMRAQIQQHSFSLQGRLGYNVGSPSYSHTLSILKEDNKHYTPQTAILPCNRFAMQHNCHARQECMCSHSSHGQFQAAQLTVSAEKKRLCR